MGDLGLEDEEPPSAAPYAVQQQQPSSQPPAAAGWGSTPLSHVPEQQAVVPVRPPSAGGPPYSSMSSEPYSPSSASRNPVVKKSWFSSLFSKSPRRKRGSSAAALSGVGPSLPGLAQGTPPRSRGSSGSGHSGSPEDGGVGTGGIGSPSSHRPGVVAMLSPKDTKVLSADIDLALQQMDQVSYKSRKKGMVFEVLHREHPKLRLKIRIAKDSKNLSSVVFKHKAGDFHHTRAIIENVRQSIGI